MRRGALYLAPPMSDHILRDIGLVRDGTGAPIRVRHHA